MSWQDIKDWLNTMDEMELAQPAFVFRNEFMRADGYHSSDEKIIGTTSKKTNTGFLAPRLIGETRKT